MSLFVRITEDGSYQLTQAGYMTVLGIIAALVLLGCYLMKADKRAKAGSRKLAFSAMALALATVASMLKIFHLPMGGSITLFSMFFVTLIGYWYGLGTGLMAAVAYGLLQLVIDPYILTLPQMLTDYVFAFGALGLSGVFSNSRHGMLKGYLLGVAGRYFFSFLSGYIFFGAYAADYGMSAVGYSLAYNGIYIFTEAGLTIALISIPAVNRALLSIRRLAVDDSETMAGNVLKAHERSGK